VETIAKIRPADYPDLLAAVDAGRTQRELALRYDCAPSLVARHVAKAKRVRAANEPALGRERDLSVESQAGSLREILEARLRDPGTSARDLASLINARTRLDADEQRHASEDALRMSLCAAKQRIRELELARIGLPKFFPGVDEWFDALPADVERWSELPGAPVELLAPGGGVHMMLPEDAAFLAEQLNWQPPPEFEPEEELIEEWRAKIVEHDARRSAAEPTLLIAAPGGDGHTTT
jgi:hypothetical protein